MVQKLGRLIRTERNAKLRQGDLLVVLIDQHRFRAVDLARHLKFRVNRISEMYHVSRMFPPTKRPPSVPYNHFWMAMRAVRRFKALGLEPKDALSEIAKHGFTQHRDVTRHFGDQLIEAESRQALFRMNSGARQSLENSCFHAPFQSLLPRFGPASIKMIWADPPYADYATYGDGRYGPVSAVSTTCDNKDSESAIRVTVDLLVDWGDRLACGGVLALWQAAGPLRSPIASAVEAHGWELETVVVWDKQNIIPGCQNSPYGRQTEWCWILKRLGDHLVNHDGSSRGDIVRSPATFRSADAIRGSAFEKPVALARFFLGKHTYPGELVFEPFGCCGSMCVAAAQTQRRWVYAESNARNFLVGSSRLARLEADAERRAG